MNQPHRSPHALAVGSFTSQLKLSEMTSFQIIIIALAFIFVGAVLAYFLWALFVILLVIGAFVILHEFLHYLRGD